MTSSGLESSRASPSEALGLIGRVLSDRYRIESLLGEGGMGAVYLAEHVLMRKRLAVKVLHAEMMRLPEMVARFEREAMAAAHIEHPNVAAATDFGKLDNGAFFLVLEYVEGTSLRDLIEKGPLEARRALHIAHQIASALARATMLGIVHRDLKPENVMLVVRDGDPDFVKVLDFGIAKVPVGELSFRGAGNEGGQVLTQLGMVYGTPEYMAPEQALGQEVDARADLYALGVILFEMLSGVRPFDADSKVALLGMKVTSDPPTIASKNASVQVPESIETAVRRLLDKEAKGRFQDAREVLDALETCAFGEAATDPPVGRLNTTPLGRATSLRQATSPRAGMSPFGPNAGTADTAAAGTPVSDTQPGRGAARAITIVVAKIREVAAHVPPIVLVAGGGFLLLLLFIAGVALLRGSSPAGGRTGEAAVGAGESRPSKPPPALAPSDVLAAAETAGSAALGELTVRFPEDPAVWRALVRAHTSEKRGADAMRAVAKLVAVSERAIDDQDVEEAVKTAVQGPTESADAAFTLMESGLGGKGPDLLYDLSTTKGLSSRALARVKQSLAKSEVKARMSPALALVIEFRAATSCESKKALLVRAKEQGDGRLLASLRTLQIPKGCGFLGLGDCWSCMRRDNALGAAMAAIEERAGK
ncbi:MAG TPA: serine/threonine-protein kinase [Polyangiaceae bacterium]|nr:serine/threonine-protein kinase [Polyangiaceae bacterium]